MGCKRKSGTLAYPMGDEGAPVGGGFAPQPQQHPEIAGGQWLTKKNGAGKMNFFCIMGVLVKIHVTYRCKFFGGKQKKTISADTTISKFVSDQNNQQNSTTREPERGCPAAALPDAGLQLSL